MLKSTAYFLLMVSSLALHGMEQENKQSLFSRFTSRGLSIVPAILNRIRTLNLGEAESTPIKETIKLKSYSGTQFITRLMATVDATTFFQPGDEVNYTINRKSIFDLIAKHPSEAASTKNALLDALNTLPRCKFIINKDAYAEKNKTGICDYRDCSPKFKFDESLGYATVVTPIRCIQLYTILDHKNIFSPELPVDEYNVDVDYGCTEDVFHLTIVKNSNSIPNPGFINHAKRIADYTINNANNVSIQNLLILKRK